MLHFLLSLMMGDSYEVINLARKISEQIRDCNESLVEILLLRTTLLLTNEHRVFYYVKKR